MVTSLTRTREGGRPRTFADEDVFAATTAILTRLGYGGLTLAAVANEVGCTGQALIRRFGSKGALLRAYLQWSVEIAARRYDAIRATHPSPLDALRGRFLMPSEERPEEVSDPPGQANLLTFMLEARHDPEYRILLAQLQHVYVEEVVDLLAEARVAGELIDCDPEALARLLISAVTGEILLWTIDPDGAIVDRMAWAFDAIIDPFRPCPSRP